MVALALRAYFVNAFAEHGRLRSMVAEHWSKSKEHTAVGEASRREGITANKLNLDSIK